MDRPLTARTRLARAAVRATNSLSRRLGRGAGTVAGGRVGLALDPHLLASLARGRRVVLVSATNGKTTTSAMLRVGWGGDVAANDTGANMPEGHVAALSASSATRAVLETDEAWLATVVAATSPEAVVLLNLSRDQLDRANEVRQLAQRWRDALCAPGFTGVVIANAADPLVVFAAQGASRVVWVDLVGTWRGDAASCPQCTRAIDFDEAGWRCACGFAQPAASVRVARGVMSSATSTRSLSLALPGAFNEANAAMVLCALEAMGEDVEAAAERISTMTSVVDRYGRRRFRGRTLRLLLAKNPAGTAALLEALDPGDEVWVAINAQVADGRDPSWLYDVPFGSLAGRRVRCLGERRLDLATRLIYDGIDAEVIDDLERLEVGEGPVTLIANYTAFREWTRRSEPC